MSKRQRVECSCPLQKREVLLLKSPRPMMFDLILDVMNGFSAKLATIVLSLRDKSHSRQRVNPGVGRSLALP